MAMEVVVRASKWVVGGKQVKSGFCLKPLRAFYNMTTLTTTNLCARNLLVKLANISEHHMGHDEGQSCQIKRQLHHQCKVSTSFINEETILMVSVKLWLGRCCDASLNHGKQDNQLKQDAGLEGPRDNRSVHVTC